jgi:hypothetical protein
MYTAIAFPFEMHKETRVHMKKSEFLLKEARELVISRPSFVEKKSNRRQFLKALGIGTLAVNPALGAVKKFTNEPFSVDFKENQLHVWRNGALAWEISNRFFTSNTQISIHQIENGWEFQINSFNFKGTQFTFNLQGTLVQVLSQWLINIQIPEFNWNSEMDFVDFLDGIKPLSADAIIDSKVVQLNNSDHISINHKVLTTLSPEWQMQFSSENAIDLYLHGKSLHTHALKILPGFDSTLPFYKDQVKGSLVQMSTFSSWPEMMTGYTYKGKSIGYRYRNKPNITNTYRKY